MFRSRITVLEEPPTTALTTLDTFKAVAGISGNDHDDIISHMIQAASDFAARYCGRIFAYQQIKESLPGSGTPDLMVSLTPIDVVNKVEFKDATIDSSEWEILDPDAGFLQRRAGFTSTNFPHRTIDNAPSPHNAYDWHITYYGGYILPGYPVSAYGNRTLPYDLERAVIEMTKAEYGQRLFDGTLKSYKIGETMVSWTRNTGNNAGGVGTMFLPNTAQTVLDYFRRSF